MPSLIGQTIGNYHVTRMLGEGGMGVVYQAEHPVIGRKVAIKLLHSWMARDPEVVARFFNEARAIHTVGHENIVEILDFGQTGDGQPYFIMEYLSGEAVSDRLTRAGALPVPLVSEVADQICRALAAAHGKGIIHRDLKPHNIHLVATESGRTFAKLLDFGVAKITKAEDLSQSVKTRSGSLMGTPLYMSPEQCKGAGEIDHRTDIYSLGVVLYEMLAGRPPFATQGVVELFAAHMLKQPPHLHDFAPSTPPAMAAAVMRALAKNPAERFSSMDDMRQAFLSDGLPIAVTGPASGGTRRYPSNPGGTLLAPSTSALGLGHAATTFSSATSEMDLVPRKKSRAPLVVGVLVLAAAGAGTYVLVTRGHGAATPHDDTAEGAPGEAPAGAAARPPAAPAPPATVTVRFEAEPAGVHVFRSTDDKDLGPAPLALTLPRHGGRPTYVLRRDGYADKTLTADLEADQTLRATLQKKAPAPSAAEKSGRSEENDLAQGRDKEKDKAPKRAAPRGKPAKTPLDQDGLATPTF